MKNLKITYKSGAAVRLSVDDAYTVEDFLKWADTVGTYGVWKFADGQYISVNVINDIAAIQIENERKQLLNE